MKSVLGVFLALGFASAVSVGGIAGGRTVNVRDFGARGDGAHDDSAAIQKALDLPARPLTVTGAIANFTCVKHLSLRKLTMRNPDAYSIRLGEVEDFLNAEVKGETR